MIIYMLRPPTLALKHSRVVSISSFNCDIILDLFCLHSQNKILEVIALDSNQQSVEVLKYPPALRK